MQRTNFKGKSKKSVDAILCADFHLREDTPVARTDDFWKAQWMKVAEVSKLQVRYGCPVIHAGDLFHHWKPSPHLLSVTMELLPNDFHTIYGQHDLPQHNLELSYKSGIHTLEMAGKINVLPGCNWGQTPDIDKHNCGIGYDEYDSEEKLITKRKRVLVWHHMVYQVKPFPGAIGGMAQGLLKKYPQFDLIVTGDNHHRFVEEREGRLLVNPGNLTRQSAAQVDYEPCVFLYYAETNTVEKVILPHAKDVISREHIETVERRDERIEAFISRLDTDWEAEMSFEENLERFAEANQVKPEVMSIIQKAIEQ